MSAAKKPVNKHNGNVAGPVSPGNGKQGQPPNAGAMLAAVYARFSTRFLDSLGHQIRECREWAQKHGYHVPDHFVFTDQAKRGGSVRRAGLQALRQVIEKRGVSFVVIFATNRLFRKTYRALQFVHEETVERGIRCVFVKSGIDTHDKDGWEARLRMQSFVDEFQLKAAKKPHPSGPQGTAHGTHSLRDSAFGLSRSRGSRPQDQSG